MFLALYAFNNFFLLVNTTFLNILFTSSLNITCYFFPGLLFSAITNDELSWGDWAFSTLLTYLGFNDVIILFFIVLLLIFIYNSILYVYCAFSDNKRLFIFLSERFNVWNPKKTWYIYVLVQTFFLGFIWVLFFSAQIIKNFSHIDTIYACNSTFYILPSTTLPILIIYALFFLVSVSLLVYTNLTSGLSKQMTDYCFLYLFMYFLGFFGILSNDMFTAFLVLEGLTLGVIILLALNSKSNKSLKSAILYWATSAVSVSFFIISLNLFYGSFGSTKLRDVFFESSIGLASLELNYLGLYFGAIFFVLGLLFKFAAFPLHFWSINVYEGANWQTLHFMSTLYKVVVFAILVTFTGSTLGFYSNLGWKPLILISIYGSVIIGALGALKQSRIKRLIGFMSLNQTGMLLVGFLTHDVTGIKSAFSFLTYYIASTTLFLLILSGFKVIDKQTGVGRSVVYLSQLSKTKQINSLVLLSLIISVFAMGGIPPLPGFFFKVNLIFQAMQSGYLLLGFVLLLSHVLSLYYYLYFVSSVLISVNEDEEVSNTIEVNHYLVLKRSKKINSIIFYSYAMCLIIILGGPWAIISF